MNHPIQHLSSKAKVAVFPGILLSAGFFIAAFVPFLREGDWPARYVSAGAMMLAVIFIAIKRRSRGRRV